MVAYDDVTPGLMDHAERDGEMALLALRDAEGWPLGHHARLEYEERAKCWARRAASFAIRALDRKASREATLPRCRDCGSPLEWTPAHNVTISIAGPDGRFVDVSDSLTAMPSTIGRCPKCGTVN